MTWHAYIDESGDRGWKKRPPSTPPGKRAGSSRTFAMTAVLVPDGSGPWYLRAWDQAAQQMGRRDVHWQTLPSTGARKHMLTTLTSLPDVKTISVVLCKWHLKNVSAIADPAFFYHWTARLLIERLSWFGKRHGNVSLVLAQVKGHAPSKVRAYLKKLGSMPTNIEWGYLSLPPAFGMPTVRRLLQLADTASGAVFAAFEPDDYGFTDQTYITLLKPVMWRPPNLALSKYGLKVGPWPDKSCAAEHTWLKPFYT